MALLYLKNARPAQEMSCGRERIYAIRSTTTKLLQTQEHLTHCLRALQP